MSLRFKWNHTEDSAIGRKEKDLLQNRNQNILPKYMFGLASAQEVLPTSASLKALWMQMDIAPF